MARELRMPMRALLVNGVQCFATLWRIVRTDAVEFRFTDHNEPITYDGLTYTPTNGVSVSARQREQGLRPQNAELVGVIDDDAISNEDMRLGRFRDCQITEIVVDWRYPWQGYFTKDVYYLGDVAHDGERWNGNVVSALRWLAQRTGEVITRKCRARLGDDRCGVNLASFTVTGSITAVIAQRLAFQSTCTEADDYFTAGLLTWTSGDNSGQAIEVKRYRQTNGAFNLELKTLKPLQVGDSFSVYAGCPHTIEACHEIFDNHLNFRGEPYTPGTDRLMQVPSSR